MNEPLAPHVSQFDKGPLANVNCTMAAAARLLRFATGNVATGSQLRACQQDLVSGTSLADTVQAMVNRHGFHPAWAGPTDGLKGLPGRKGSSITMAQLNARLAEGHMVILQGNYNVLSEAFRDQKAPLPDPKGGHAMTIDALDPAKGYLVFDPINKNPDHKGKFIPVAEIENYAFKFTGSSIAFAAWAKRGLSGTRRGDLACRLVSAPIGVATVKGDGHSLIRMADGRRTKVAAGLKVKVHATASLHEPLDGGPSNRQGVHIVNHVALSDDPPAGSAYLLLVIDSTFAPA